MRYIETEDDYRKALKEVEQLMDAKSGTEEGARLDALVELILEYEKTTLGTGGAVMDYRFSIVWCDNYTYEVHAADNDIEVVCVDENRRPAAGHDARAMIAHAIIAKAKESGGPKAPVVSSWWRDDGVTSHAKVELETPAGMYQIYASAFDRDMSSTVIEVSLMDGEAMRQVLDDSRIAPIAAYLTSDL